MAAWLRPAGASQILHRSGRSAPLAFSFLDRVSGPVELGIILVHVSVIVVVVWRAVRSRPAGRRRRAARLRAIEPFRSPPLR